jgi:hypothetical protein
LPRSPEAPAAPAFAGAASADGVALLAGCGSGGIVLALPFGVTAPGAGEPADPVPETVAAGGAVSGPESVHATNANAHAKVKIHRFTARPLFLSENAGKRTMRRFTRTGGR